MLIRGVVLFVLVFISRAALADPVTSAVASPNQNTVEILGRLPSIEKIAISPDGLQLAMIRTKENQRLLVFVSLKDGKVSSTHGVGENKIRYFEWADNNNLLMVLKKFGYIKYFGGGPAEDLYAVASMNVEKQRIVNPLDIFPEADSRQHGLTASNQIIANPVVRTVNGDKMIFVPGLTAGNESLNASGFMFLMPSMLKFKAGINVTSLVGRSKESNIQWIVDDQGKQIAESIYDDDTQTWTLRMLINGWWKEVMSESFSIERPEVVGLTPDGTALLVDYYDKKTGDFTWMSVSLKDATVVRPLQDMAKYNHAFTSTYSPRVLGAYRAKDNSLEFFEPRLQEAWSVINTQFEGEYVEYITATEDLKKIVLKVEGVRDGYAYWLFDKDKFKFTQLGAVYSGYKKLAEVKKITYEARDNYKLDAYLTLPDREKKNLPVIVMPHGGPAWHDDGHFDEWAQLFASQGYLVVQPNFRGSNLSTELLHAGYGEWGRKMQTDIEDVLQPIIKEGLADRKRVCIVGGSFGGYSALAGAAFGTSGTYRCAISFAGISNLGEFRNYLMMSRNRRNSVETRHFDRFVGASSQDDRVLSERSPINSVNNIGIPVLLIHGTNDSVVPIKQSELMYDAMKKANANVEFIKLEKDDHHLSNSVTRYQALKAMVDFLKKYNPPEEQAH